MEKKDKMLDLIVIAGAPGSGKSTISNLLKETLNSPMITFGHIRGFHMNSNWSNANPKEHEMAFENMNYIVRNYLKNNYKNIILNDLEEFRVEQIPHIYGGIKYAICTLYVNNDQELKNRVLNDDRDSGFRNYELAIAWNNTIRQRTRYQYEYIIDNSSNDYQIALTEILKIINKEI